MKEESQFRTNIRVLIFVLFDIKKVTSVPVALLKFYSTSFTVSSINLGRVWPNILRRAASSYSTIIFKFYCAACNYRKYDTCCYIVSPQYYFQTEPFAFHQQLFTENSIYPALKESLQGYSSLVRTHSYVRASILSWI